MVPSQPLSSRPSQSRSISSTGLFLSDTTTTTTSPYVSTPWMKPSLNAVEKFESLRRAFPVDADVVNAGGWYSLEKLVATTNPKDELVSLIVNGLKGKKIQFTTAASTNEKISALLLLLYGMGKGFDADNIAGEWDLVFTKQGSKSPSFQKWVGNKEQAGLSKNWFDITSMTFSGLVQFWKFGKVGTKVKYDTTVDAYSKTSNGKIVLRRIVCTILNAFIKWWKLPGLPIPVPKKPGYLDVIYLDKDIRVTKGNRGGLFVHFRPSYLKQVMEQQ